MRYFSIVLVLFLSLSPVYAGFLDDLTIVPESEVKEMQKELERLRKENVQLKKELESLKKNKLYRAPQVLRSSDYRVLCEFPELNDGDSEAISSGDSSRSWVLWIDLLETREVKKLILNFKKKYPEIDLMVTYYDEKKDKWKIADEVTLVKNQLIMEFSVPLKTSLIKIVPEPGIKNLEILEPISVSVEGYE